MTNTWQNGGAETAVDVRPGGPGNGWRLLDINGMIDAASGGGRARTTLWGRGRVGLEPRGFIYTGNPNDRTANMSYPLNAQNFLLDVLFKCPFDARMRQRCNRVDLMNSYGNPGIIGLLEATNNDFSYSDALANADGVQADVKEQVALAATLLQKYTLVAHDDITLTTQDSDINKVLSIGAFRCQGACGVGKSEEDEWLWVTDRDSTPGYSGNATARLGYTTDRFVTRNSVPIDLFQAADATDVVFLGDRIIVFSASKAPAYASWTDILNGVTAPNLWTAMTGFTGITAGNFPSKASAPDSATIFMVGAGGRIWKSIGGTSATLIADTGVVTSQNLTTVDFQTDKLGFIGGASGTFIRYYNGAMSVISITDGTNTVSAQLNRVRVPSKRESEVYIGTAGGELWRTRNATDTRPTFERLSGPLFGTGAITDLDFAGYKGDQLYILHTNSSNQSIVYRDLSGGAGDGGLGGIQIEKVGEYVSPGSKMNSIAMANVNMGAVVGDVKSTSYGFIGMIRPNLI
jgi:hypothetical protein